jgi:hypothetical protein
MLPSLITLLHNRFFLIIAILEEAENTDFSDLGKLLFAGFAAAIVIALTFTLVKLHLRDKRPAENSFISIGSFRRKE